MVLLTSPIRLGKQRGGKTEVKKVLLNIDFGDIAKIVRKYTGKSFYRTAFLWFNGANPILHHVWRNQTFDGVQLS